MPTVDYIWPLELKKHRPDLNVIPTASLRPLRGEDRWAK
jgi:hypothetical protein